MMELPKKSSLEPRLSSSFSSLAVPQALIIQLFVACSDEKLDESLGSRLQKEVAAITYDTEVVVARIEHQE